MSETLALKPNDTLPVINRTELLKDSQNREFNRLLWTLESDRFSLVDLEDILIQIWESNPKARPYILDFRANFNAWLEQIFVQSKPWITASNDNKKEQNITLTPSVQEELVKTWESEIKSREQELKKLEQKLIQINLISQVASMYKEYLQNIMEAIKFKSIPDIFSKSPNMFKDERYAGQIKVIWEKVRFLDNLVSFLSTLWNYDEVKNLDIGKILNELFVSEKELSENWIMSQPLINWVIHKEARVSWANEWYEEIKRMLLNPNLTIEQAEKIKISIFEKIRRFDELWNDDNWLVFDSWEAISARISSNILENKKLRERPDINDVFTSLESFWNDKKEALLKSLNSWKEWLKGFINWTWLLEKVWFKNEKAKTNFIESLYKNLKENLWKIDDSKVSEELIKKINEQFDFQKTRLPKEKLWELEEKRKEALSNKNISLGVQTLKQESTFMIFEKMFMNKVLENNSNFVENLWKSDNAVNLYRNIEWIWDKVSDKTFNSISVWTQFLTEQIAIMLVSWVIGWVLAKWWWLLMWRIAPASQNLPWALKWTTQTMVEWTWFYFGYTWINGLVHEEKLWEIMKNYSHYDLARTIVFLWVLRSLPLDKAKEMTNIQNSFLNEVKNISLDTTAILWTDIAIRWASMLLTGKEWFKTDVDWNVTPESIWEFLVEELAFIIPLIIWLRQSDKAVASLFENWKKPKITVITKENEFIIQIEWLKKEIRALRQQRNSLRNKWKSSKEVNEELKIKKKEYKQMRDENADILAKSWTWNTDTPTAVLPNQNQPQNPKESSKQPKDTNNQKDNVNMNTWIRSLQDVLNWKNIEDVMKWFDQAKRWLSQKFQELLRDWWDKTKAEEFIRQEVDIKVKELDKAWVKIDPVEWELFIKRFKEERIAEFEQLIKIKEQWGKIPEDMKVSYKWREWDLKLRDVKGMNEYFGEWLKMQDYIPWRGNNHNNDNL